jgi:hypothetical protein
MRSAATEKDKSQTPGWLASSAGADRLDESRWQQIKGCEAVRHAAAGHTIEATSPSRWLSQAAVTQETRE